MGWKAKHNQLFALCAVTPFLCVLTTMCATTGCVPTRTRPSLRMEKIGGRKRMEKMKRIPSLLTLNALYLLPYAAVISFHAMELANSVRKLL